jgi:hypothetical protein
MSDINLPRSVQKVAMHWLVNDHTLVFNSRRVNEHNRVFNVPVIVWHDFSFRVHRIFVFNSTSSNIFAIMQAGYIFRCRDPPYVNYSARQTLALCV